MYYIFIVHMNKNKILTFLLSSIYSETQDVLCVHVGMLGAYDCGRQTDRLTDRQTDRHSGQELIN